MKKARKSRILAFIMFILCSPSQAIETLGTLNLQDVLVRPAFIIKRPQGGEFSIGETSFALQWDNSDMFSSYMMIGPKALVNQAGYYLEPNSQRLDDFTFVEAYGQIAGAYGRFRLGMIPIEYGAEGQLRESEIVFPRSLIFSRGLVGLRDLGASYSIRNDGYFTRVAVHNGEGGQNRDSRLWYTGAWGWSNGKQFEVGLVGSTGSTTPESTRDSLTNFKVGRFDSALSAKIRMFGGYIKWSPRYWQLLAEFSSGELTQTSSHKFYVGHLDVIYEISPSFSALLRYDELNPNTSPSERTRQVSYGAAYRAAHDTSAVYLIGSHVMIDNRSASEEFRLILRLTPIPVVTVF